LLLYGLINRVPDARNADHVLGFVSFKVLFEIANIGVNLRASLGKQEVFDAAFVGVPTGQNAEDAVAGFGLENCAHGDELVLQVAVSQHDAFGFAGGAAGVEESGEGLLDGWPLWSSLGKI